MARDEERIRQASEALAELERAGADLDEILNGETGRRWIEESCGGDLELARAAFERRHPRARFVEPFEDRHGGDLDPGR